jgi:hypothetical protein
MDILRGKRENKWICKKENRKESLDGCTRKKKREIEGIWKEENERINGYAKKKRRTGMMWKFKEEKKEYCIDIERGKETWRLMCVV